MFTLPNRKDGFRLLLPKEFLLPEVFEKYSEILSKKHGYYINPIDFLNESIQKVDVLGINNAAIQQQQTNRGIPIRKLERERQNNFLYPSIDFSYRNPGSPLSLLDMTLNIEFKHTLGYLNYMMVFENFWLQYSRDTDYEELPDKFSIDLINEKGVIFCKIQLESPIINGMDMLSFDYSQPVAQSESFKVEFKYSNFNFEFPEY